MSNVSKSHRSNDPIVKYCTSISVKQDPILQKLTENTLKNAPMGLGAPEVHQFGQNLIRLTHAKRALDIDGEVISMDIDLEKLKRYGKEFIDSKPEISKKINFKLGPAVQTLDSLIAAGESGKWDFAFIDADKTSYPYYYEKCVQLLRPGGVILIDNALRCGRVVLEDKDDETKAIDETNHIIANDTRVDNMLLNLGDGTHVVFKKYE
uniref:O-methyltransferase n=1 Tax=Ascaris lumbricoides TaxID=6252 RepID=A0A0M3IHN3_ASCLU